MKKIYDVIYAGGAAQNTPMVTLGFSKGILKKDREYTPLIEADRIKRAIVSKKIEKIDTMRKKVFELFDQGIDRVTIMKICDISSP